VCATGFLPYVHHADLRRDLEPAAGSIEPKLAADR
jgi:hypothetical protein